MLLSENKELAGNDFPYSFSIQNDVLEELVFAAEYDKRDSFALLLGDRNEKSVLIDGFSSLQIVKLREAFFHVKGSLTERLVAQTQQQIQSNIEIEPSHPSAGWFVSQPDGNAILTKEMMKVHFSLFNLPHLPILVFDPLNQKIALYGREKHRFKNIPFTTNHNA